MGAFHFHQLGFAALTPGTFPKGTLVLFDYTASAIEAPSSNSLLSDLPRTSSRESLVVTCSHTDLSEPTVAVAQIADRFADQSAGGSDEPGVPQAGTLLVVGSILLLIAISSRRLRRFAASRG